MASIDTLTPQQDRTWSLLVGVMMWLPAELDTWLVETANISHAEFGVLRCLSADVDRELHMSRLAATASVTPSHLSRIVGRLQQRGLLLRRTDEADARRTLARLTVDGAHLVEAIEPSYVTELRVRVFNLLGPDQIDSLEQVAETILTALRPECVALLPGREVR